MSAADAPPSCPDTLAVAPWAAIALIVGMPLSVLPLSRGPAGVPPASLFEAGLTATAEVRAPFPDELAGSEIVPFATSFVAPWLPLPAGAGDLVIVTRRGARLPDIPADFEVELTPLGGWLLLRASSGDSPADLRPSAPVSYEVEDHLRAARVEIEHADGSVRRCDRWMFGRWDCGPDEWNYVGLSDVQIRGRIERCIWAHPTGEGTLVIRFTGLPVGALITGRHGISDIGAASAVDGEFTFEVRIDGEKVETRRQSRRRGLSSFRIVNDVTDDDTFDLEFRVGGETTAQRHFCFTATVRDFRGSSRPSPSRERAVASEHEGSATAPDAETLRQAFPRIPGIEGLLSPRPSPRGGQRLGGER